MRILVIEDEHPASQKLIRLLEQIDSAVEIADVLKSVEQAINWFLRNPAPDLIFMDIQLEDGLCFEIFESCKIEAPMIFTTAYDEYALQAFKVNSVDYLLKPIVPEELKRAIDKFKAIHYPKVGDIAMSTIIRQLQPQTKERFLIKIGEYYKSVQTSAVHCFYIKNRYCSILINTGKSYPVEYSLDKLEDLLDSKMFFRINRNMIINFSAIADIVAYSTNRLKIVIAGWAEKEDIVVSRERVQEFKNWLDR